MKKLLLLFVLIASAFRAQENPMSWDFETKKIYDSEYDIIFKMKIEAHLHS